MVTQLESDARVVTHILDCKENVDVTLLNDDDDDDDAARVLPSARIDTLNKQPPATTCPCNKSDPSLIIL